MGWEFDFLYALQGIHGPVLDKIMVILTYLGEAGIAWILLSIILACIPDYRRVGLQMMAAMAVAFVIGNLILKHLIARDRPCWIDPEVELLVKVPKDFSFPSGHTLNGFTAAFTILFNDAGPGVLALLLAAAIAFSRLYLFVHFPTDVIGGFVIGLIVAFLVHAIAEHFWGEEYYGGPNVLG